MADDTASQQEPERPPEELPISRSRRGQTLTFVASPLAPLEGGSVTLPFVKRKICYGIHSVQGQRATMEDDHICIHQAEAESPLSVDDDNYSPHSGVSFFAVYDGHAGTAAAQFLRTRLHRYVLRHPQLVDDPELALRDGIASVEKEFVDYAEDQRLDGGSTLAVVLIVGNEVVSANVGDSETILSRGGTPVVLTTIHNMMKNNEEEDRVKHVGGRVHQKRLGHPRFNPWFVSIAVTRSIGDVFFKSDKFTEGKPSGLIAEADTRKLVLQPEDEFLVIGCDGLWDVMTYQQAVDFVQVRRSESKEPQTICEELVNKALEMGSTDNITAVLITLT